jgi:Uma2 family endonuclease
MTIVTDALPRDYRATYADWLRMPDDGRFHEVVEGELVVTPPPSIAHQEISQEIQVRLYEFLRRTGAGKVLPAPTGVRLSDDTVLEPDLVVVLAAHYDRIGEQVIDGPPDLVVEVLSRGSAHRDVGVKRRAYEKYGVPEHWIVDPVGQKIEALRLVAGRYVATTFGSGEMATSTALPGFALPVGAVFAARA